MNKIPIFLSFLLLILTGFVTSKTNKSKIKNRDLTFYREEALTLFETIMAKNNDAFSQYEKVVLKLGDGIIDTVPLTEIRNKWFKSNQFKTWICDSLLKNKTHSCHEQVAYLNEIFRDDEFLYNDDYKISIENGMLLLSKKEEFDFMILHYFKFNENGVLTTKISMIKHQDESGSRTLLNDSVTRFFKYNKTARLLITDSLVYYHDAQRKYHSSPKYRRTNSVTSYDYNETLKYDKITKKNHGLPGNEEVYRYQYDNNGQLTHIFNQYNRDFGKYKGIAETEYKYDSNRRLTSINDKYKRPWITQINYSNNIINTRFFEGKRNYRKHYDYTFELLQ